MGRTFMNEELCVAVLFNSLTCIKEYMPVVLVVEYMLLYAEKRDTESTGKHSEFYLYQIVATLLISLQVWKLIICTSVCHLI